MKKELTFYYKIKKPDNISEQDMNKCVDDVNKLFYRYAFTKVTYPSIKDSYGGVFYIRHYDWYIIKVQFINRKSLLLFKVNHMNLYLDMIKYHPCLIHKDDFI